jgi:PBP1b-binding outer membrane lipoprotein LpoB
MTFALRIAMLLLVILALTGCPGPNYAPYNNMRNSYG